MTDKLTIDYEVFEEEAITVLSISKGDEVIAMFQGNQATAIYRLLTGESRAIQAARFGLLLDIAGPKN